MPNRYGEHPDPEQPNPTYTSDLPHRDPQAAITNCSLLRPLNPFIAALVAEAERLHGRIGRRRL